MAYSFMEVYKVKSSGQLKSKCNHNCRKVEIDNVISELSSMNDELIPLPKDKNGQEMDYNQAVKQRMKETEQFRDKKPRNDAVKAFEVLLTFSQDEGINVEEWEKRSIEWLKNTFDIAPDGKSNVIHAVCHKDEPGNIHIHAMVVPIDERGHLNARRWTNGSRAMSNLQTSYAEAVEDLGLERGLKGSSASHKDLRKLYAETNRDMDNIPKVKEGETAEQYRQRVWEVLQEQRAMDIMDLYKKNRGLREKMDKDRISQYEAIEEELQNQKLTAQVELNTIQQRQREAEAKLASAEKKNEELLKAAKEKQKEIDELTAKIETDKHLINDAEKYRRLEAGISYLQSKDIDKATDILENFDYVDQVYEEYLAHKEKEQEEQKDAQESDVTDVL